MALKPARGQGSMRKRLDCCQKGQWMVLAPIPNKRVWSDIDVAPRSAQNYTLKSSGYVALLMCFLATIFWPEAWKPSACFSRMAIRYFYWLLLDKCIFSLSVNLVTCRHQHPSLPFCAVRGEQFQLRSAYADNAGGYFCCAFFVRPISYLIVFSRTARALLASFDSAGDNVSSPLILYAL